MMNESIALVQNYLQSNSFTLTYVCGGCGSRTRIMEHWLMQPRENRMRSKWTWVLKTQTWVKQMSAITQARTGRLQSFQRTQTGNTGFTNIHTQSTPTRLSQDQGPPEHLTDMWAYTNRPPRGTLISQEAPIRWEGPATICSSWQGPWQNLLWGPATPTWWGW